MSNEATTPAASRRFLPPSASSGAKPSGPGAIRQTPFHSTRSTPLPTSSNVASGTPRFQRPTPRVEDDIQTSFEGEIDSPTLSRPILALTGRDLIEEGDDAEEEPQEEEEEEEEALTPPGRGGPRRLGSVADTIRASAPRQAWRASVIPPPKKPKIESRTPKSREPVTISSSPDSDDTVARIRDSESPDVESDFEDILEPATKGISVYTRSHQLGRFKASGPGIGEPLRVPTATFKAADEAGHWGPAGGGPVLPDVFSPSKQQRKRDYVAGSSADLVRSWVVDIATQENQVAKMPEEVMVVSHVTTDISGRFTIASTEDESTWLLPTHVQRSMETRGASGHLRPGARVKIRGRAMKWDVQLDGRGSQRAMVAADWENMSS